MSSIDNLSRSVKDRLLNIAKNREEDFNHILIRYGLERTLYRLSQSIYKDKFVLKGATLFVYWCGGSHRPTLDIDLHCRDELTVAEIERVIKKISKTEVEDDGLIIYPETVQGEEIREGEVYQGVRVKLTGDLDDARVPIQLDIGFGDSLQPGVEIIEYPTLLDFPGPELNAYKPVISIAEKSQFMVEAGVFNSRMKDYYDVWFLCNEFQFEGSNLRSAIESTFTRRKTKVPEVPLPVLQSVFLKAARS